MKLNNLKGDIYGGLTAGIVALPLALAFGIQAFGGVDDPSASSIGALAGLVGATFLGFFASLFGGCHSQISGPTGPMTVVTASLIGGIWSASSGNISVVLLGMSMAGLFCGIFQILFGVIGIGKYIKYIPYPVLSGFMSGIGVIIILQQIYPLLGFRSPVLVLDMVVRFPETVAKGISVQALILGVGSILIIKLFPYITKKVPSTLVALIVMTIVSLFMHLSDNLIIGDIPSGLPVPFFVRGGLDFSTVDWGLMFRSAIVPGITLASLGSIDTLLTSVVADNITKTKHNSNRELIGQGIGNAMAGTFCGISGAGATMRTVVNVKSGGRNRLSGMIHSILLLAIILGLGRFVKFVPLSVLAGILITVGLSIIDFRGFKDLIRVPRSDAIVLLTVFGVTVFVDLLTAVGIGMVIACVFFMKKMSDVVENTYSDVDVKDLYRENRWDDDPDFPEQSKIVIRHLEGPLFFGTVSGFKNMMESVPSDSKVVIIRMKKVSYMDQSGLYALESVINDLQANGIRVVLTMIQDQPYHMMKNVKMVPGVISKDDIFRTIEECRDYFHSLSGTDKQILSTDDLERE